MGGAGTLRDFVFNNWRNKGRDWRLSGAVIEVRNGAAETISLGAVYERKNIATGVSRWVPTETDDLDVETFCGLSEDARLEALRDIRDENERAHHRPYCRRRMPVSASDECSCDLAKARHGRMA